MGICDGNLWITLTIGMGLSKQQMSRTLTDTPLGYRQSLWGGWGMKVTPGGTLVPVCAGMRSPCGIGMNREGDVFYSDQQGNWVAANSLHHIREGAFFHHAEALASMNLTGSSFQDVKPVPDGVPYPEAIKQFTQLRPPAVWFPYRKAGQSTTDIMLDDSHGRFGPFDGQLFVGEFTQASIHRVFLEKVGGGYQGACFSFRSRFASAVLRLAQGTDGSVFVGLTNRGWSSLGTSAYGLQRRVFTSPVEMKTASDTGSYEINSHTYNYQSTYGSDEIQQRTLGVKSATVSADGLRVQLRVDGLRELFVHELVAAGVRSQSGFPPPPRCIPKPGTRSTVFHKRAPACHIQNLTDL